jgi:general secretion pathway protein C
MSQSSKKSTIGIVVATLLALVITKAMWVAVDVKQLPKKGVDLQKHSDVKRLYYHYNLASKKEKPKAIVKKVNKPKPKPKPKEPEKITKFSLKGLYNSKEKKIIIVEYKNKSYALSINDELEGYKFTKLFAKYAIFQKDGKEYKLDLYKPKKGARDNMTRPTPTNNRPPEVAKEQKPQDDGLTPIKEDDGTVVIPKSLFNKYQGDYRAIRRNINAVPNMENGKLNGFKISFVRKGSDFSKLGIKRGDIIMAINGEPLDNFKVPLEFFNNASSLSAATFTIKRGNEIKELEYEVR